MRTITKIILTIAIISFILFVIYGIYLNLMSEHLCKIKCEKENSLANEVFHSGNWRIDDICICYFEDEIKSFKLGA